MRRAFIVGLAALHDAIVAGCGGSSASDKQVEAITRTYNTYIAAVKSGDGKTACEQLTPTFQRRATRIVTPLAKLRHLKGASCPRAIVGGTLPQLKAFEPHLERVEVKGDKASGFQPPQEPFGREKVIFRRIDGEWKISAVLYQKRS